MYGELAGPIHLQGVLTSRQRRRLRKQKIPCFAHLRVPFAPITGEQKPLHAHKLALMLEEQVRSCSVLVGLHADEPTEAIVDTALHLGKSFAVVPCCVFHHLW